MRQRVDLVGIVFLSLTSRRNQHHQIWPAMPDLSEDILTEILLRLPVKPLAWSKCVCKQWRSLISDSIFTPSHLRRSLSRDPYSGARILLTGHPLRSISTKSIDNCDGEYLWFTVLGFPVKTPEEDFGFEVVGSCDGLLGVVIDSETLAVWNPTTRECRELPGSGFAPLGAKFFYGLGYDSQAKDYKLVRGHRMDVEVGPDSSHTKVEIFSLKSNSWKSVQFEDATPAFTSFGMYVDGSLHWLVTGNPKSKPVNKIVSFDLSMEKFHETVNGSRIDDYETVPLTGIGIDRERLFVYRDSGSDVDAWAMNNRGDESYWTKLCHIEGDVLSFTMYGLNLVGFTADRKVMFDLDGWELGMYDPKEDSTNTCDFENEWEFFGCTTYVESLVSPHSTEDNIR